MKKTYIAPMAGVVRMHTEAMLAASNHTKQYEYNNSDALDSEDGIATKGHGWSSNMWTND